MRETFKLTMTAIFLFLSLLLLTGILYPLLMTGISQLLFPIQANGSLFYQHGKVVGARWIGQSFTDPKFFWGRPSATASFPYNGLASGSSNFTATNKNYLDEVQRRIDNLKMADPINQNPVPVDLVMSSGSGLDPHISPFAAFYQAHRVAQARGLPLQTVERLIIDATRQRTFGILGEPRVNVLRLNLMLEQINPTQLGMSNAKTPS